MNEDLRSCTYKCEFMDAGNAMVVYILHGRQTRKVHLGASIHKCALSMQGKSLLSMQGKSETTLMQYITAQTGCVDG